MKFSFSEIVDVTAAEVLYSSNNSGIFSLSTDTRTIKPEEIYIPIKGENFDGHNFIEDAIKKSSRGYFIDESELGRLKDLPRAKFALKVKDTREAYLALAGAYKEKVHPITVAITGSSGKTTAKEMVSLVLEQKYKVHKTMLNHNNEIGVAQTMLSMPEDTEFLVVEMGMRGLGEIELLSKYTKPDIAVITNIGTAHIGKLKTQKNIAKAKCEILKHLHKEGFLIAYDDEFIKKCAESKNALYFSLNCPYLSDVQASEDSVEFKIKKHPYKINANGEYNILNAMVAIQTGLKAGISEADVAKGLELYRPAEQRGKITEVCGIRFINDSYNANPESMIASIQGALDSHKKISLILGDMEELGEKEIFYHREIGRFLRGKNIEHLITVGEKAEHIARVSKIKGAESFKDSKSVAKYLKTLDHNSVILLKASRSMKLEQIIKDLEK